MYRKIGGVLLSFFAMVLTAAEAIPLGEELSEWNVSDRSQVASDPENKVGKASIRMENPEGKTLILRRVLELEPATRYNLTFYVKGKEIRGGNKLGACIRINGGKRWERITASPGHAPETGTFDWKKGSGIIDTGLFSTGKINLELSLNCAGTVWFDELNIKKADGPSLLRLEKEDCFYQAHDSTVKEAAWVPLGVFGFFEPGEPVAYHFFIDGTAGSYEFTLSVKDDTGKTVFKQEKKPLAEEMNLPGQPCGYYSVECDIYADGQKAYTIQGGFAVSPVPGRRDPFFQFGSGVIPELHDGYKRVGCGSIQIKLAGATAAKDEETVQRRINFLLGQYKPFLESGDFLLQGYVGTGLAKTSVRTPEEIAEGYPLLDNERIRQYLNFITVMQEKLKVKEWFIGQETPSQALPRNTGTWSEAMANFVVLTRLASRRLKKLDPEIRVYAGGNNVLEKTEDIEPIQMGDILPDFDGYYIDAYTGNWDLAKGGVLIPEIDLMKFYRKASALSVKLGKGKEIVNNECGYSIPYRAPFDRGIAMEQARLTARSLILSKAASVVLFYQLYQPNCYNWTPNFFEWHMATIWKSIPVNKKYHRVPLPGGAMFATAASELAFVKAQAEIIDGSIYSCVFTKPDGAALVTLWNTEKQQPFRVQLPEGSRILNMYGRDITGQPLVISPDPVYITIRQDVSEVVSLMKNAVRDNAPEAVCAALPETVFVKSLVTESREGEIRFPGTPPVPVKILPGRINSFTMPVSAPGKLVIGSREYDIPLEKIQTLKLRRLEKPADIRKGEPGILRYPDHIRPLEALHPERGFFRSDIYNPDGHDVSAKYWTGYDENNFYLSVDVDDPVHLQRQPSMELWRDDCLQFVLSPQDYPPASMRLANEKTPRSEYNFGLALTDQGPRLVKFLGKDAGVVNLPVNVSRENGITRYDAAIPWTAVGGKARRFGFVIFDNNNPVQKSAPYRLEFSEGITGDADSSKLAKVEYE